MPVVDITKFRTYDNIHSAATIYNSAYDRLKWVVPGIVPLDGVTMIVAPPKAGKSMLMLSVCTAYALSHADYDVLYLDLENTHRRVCDRLESILGKGKLPPNLYLSMDWDRLDTGGKSALEEYLDHNPYTRLVVVDTFGKIQSIRNQKNSYSYSMDQIEIDVFKNIAKAYNVAFVLVHHTNKRGTDKNWVDKVSGTHGLSGTVDTLLYMEKSDNTGRSVLHVTGRDVKFESYELRFKNKKGGWIIGEPTSVYMKNMAQARQEVYDVLYSIDGTATPKELAEVMSKTVGAVKKQLANLLADGTVIKEGHGNYCTREIIG